MRARPILLAAALAGSPTLGTAPVALADKDAGALPPGTLRGPAYRLNQYPTLSLATARQRAAARRLAASVKRAARRWRDPRAAVKSGFRVRPRARPAGRVGYLHAESRAYAADDDHLEPRRPEALIYANVPGHPLVLIGVMFSVPRGVHGPTPGGPITRWHTHTVCVQGRRRGRAPRSDGSCPRGWRSRQGSEMLHLWFTRDLRSQFAIHGPVPELCTARFLPRRVCRHTGHGHG